MWVKICAGRSKDVSIAHSHNLARLTFNKGKHGSLLKDIDIFTLHIKAEMISLHATKYVFFPWWEKSFYFTEVYIINRGYFMAARGYEFYLRVLKVSLTSERSERVRDTFSTRR